MREYKRTLCELINKIDKKSSLERLYKLDEIKRRGGLNSSVLLSDCRQRPRHSAEDFSLKEAKSQYFQDF